MDFWCTPYQQLLMQQQHQQHQQQLLQQQQQLRINKEKKMQQARLSHLQGVVANLICAIERYEEKVDPAASAHRQTRKVERHKVSAQDDTFRNLIKEIDVQTFVVQYSIKPFLEDYTKNSAEMKQQLDLMKNYVATWKENRYCKQD